MSDSNPVEYYRGRERKERALAAGCIDPGIAAIHIEMADRYFEMVRDADLKAMSRLKLCIPANDRTSRPETNA